MATGPDNSPCTAFTVDLTGPDWEPTPATAWFAQRGTQFAFGPDPVTAIAALINRATPPAPTPVKQDDSSEDWAREMTPSKVMSYVGMVKFREMTREDLAGWAGAEPGTLIGDTCHPAQLLCVTVLMTETGFLEVSCTDNEGEIASVCLDPSTGVFERLI